MEDAGKKALTKKCIELTNKALEAIQCPACFETSGSYFQCTVGHHICKNCYTKVGLCPTCRSPLSNTRCFVIETLHESFNSVQITLKSLDQSLNTPENEKILQYRHLIRSILTQYTKFLNDSQITFSFLNNYLQDPFNRDHNEMVRKVNFITSQLFGVKQFLTDTEQTLLDLKK